MQGLQMVGEKKKQNIPALAVPPSQPSWTSIPTPLPPHSSGDVLAFLPKEVEKQNQISCRVYLHVCKTRI